jgi:predicted Zn finger-like uncharacterized protein
MADDPRLFTTCPGCGGAFAVDEAAAVRAGGAMRCGLCGVSFDGLAAAKPLWPAAMSATKADADWGALAPHIAPLDGVDFGTQLEQALGISSAPVAREGQSPAEPANDDAASELDEESSHLSLPLPAPQDEPPRAAELAPLAAHSLATEGDQADEDLAGAEVAAISSLPSETLAPFGAREMGAFAEERSTGAIPEAGELPAVSDADARAFEPPSSAGFLPPSQSASFLGAGKSLEPWTKTLAKGALLTLLSAGLGLQLGYAYREEIASRAPWARSALSQACGWMGCSAGLEQARDRVTLEDPDVAIDADGLLVFTATVKNAADFDSAAPNLWLSVEGPAGKSMAARSFEPQEWAGGTVLVAGSEREVRLTFPPLESAPENFKAMLDWTSMSH